MSDIQDRMKFKSGTDKVTKSVADDVVTIGTLAVDTAQGVVVAGADLGKGVVTTVSDAVDKQTDELQDKEEEAPKATFEI